MVLYFNCRITPINLTPNRLSSGYFYPQVYPKSVLTNLVDSPFKILLKTIESYSRIKFKHVIFNIVIDGQEINKQNEINELIYNSFPNSKISLSFMRPSKVNEWIDDAQRLQGFIDSNTPILVVMNHDHPFVDLDDRILNDIVEKIFNSSQSCFGKVFYYSHAPEVISWAMNGRGTQKFNLLSAGIYESTYVNNWIDSIGIMTLDTLIHIWKSVKSSEDYIGRFDWQGVSYNHLNLKTYVFPREFFRHFDGYNHITGIRLLSEMNLYKEFVDPIPNNKLLTDYYYQKWLDNFLLALRDYLSMKSSFHKSNRMIFIEGIEKTIELFKKGYLEADASLGLIEQQMLPEFENALRNKIYYNGNYLYQQLSIDIELLKGSKISVLKNKLIIYIPSSIMKYILKIRNFTKNDKI